MNNKPNYSEGTARYQIVNLLHGCSVITPRCYSLFDNAQQLANMMVKLRKEGIVEKSYNGEVFSNFVMSNYYENMTEYFFDNVPDENLEYFDAYGFQDTKRAKYSKDKSLFNSKRILRNAEVLALMVAAGVPALPADKKDVIQDKMLMGSAYYQAREIKRYAGYKDDVEEHENERTVVATRISGTLLSAGGNYNIYHVGKDIQTWSAQGEYKIKNFIQNMLAQFINKESFFLDNAILITYDMNVFLKLIDPGKKLRARYDGLNMTYKNLYVVPYDKYGREMIKIMNQVDWEYRLKLLVTEESPQNTDRLDTTCDYYDGKTYTFVFCVPNMARYIDFLRKAILVNNKEMFSVICFDFQLDFVKRSIGGFARILVAPFDEMLSEWNGQRNLA